MKKHVIHMIIMFTAVITLLLLGSYNISKLRQDYNGKIAELNYGLQDKQGQIDDLSNKLAATNQLLAEANEKIGIKLDDIEATSKKYGSQIEKIQETSEQYEMQLGELNQQLSDLAVDSESFSSIISGVINGVVSVVTNKGQGSGAIISSDGYVVTNYHVIAGARSASVMTYDGRTHRISLEGYDETQDLAVLKIMTNETFERLLFGDSSNLKAGQKVVALGNPAGLSFTATEGIISSPERTLDDGLKYIQTDVTLNPGNSGGPLINSQGKIIGIVNSKISGYEELGFAIPSSRVKDVVDEIVG